MKKLANTNTGKIVLFRTRKKQHLNNYSVHMKFYRNDIWISAGMVHLHWKLHIVTAALQNYKFVEYLWEIYVSLLAVYVTLQQPQKV